MARKNRQFVKTTKYQIYQYWVSDPEPIDGWIPIIDPGEQCCMACHQMDVVDWPTYKEESPKGTFEKYWNLPSMLQRAHIIPDALGGKDEPSNLVLLCPMCHDEMPNTTNRQLFLKTLANHGTTIRNIGNAAFDQAKLILDWPDDSDELFYDKLHLVLTNDHYIESSINHYWSIYQESEHMNQEFKLGRSRNRFEYYMLKYTVATYFVREFSNLLGKHIEKFNLLVEEAKDNSEKLRAAYDFKYKGGYNEADLYDRAA